MRTPVRDVKQAWQTPPAMSTISPVLSLRFLDDRPNAMKPGRAVRNLVAVFADLKFAVAISSANYQFGFAFFVGRPLVAPKTPAQLGSRFSNHSVIPSFAVIAANLHF